MIYCGMSRDVTPLRIRERLLFTLFDAQEEGVIATNLTVHGVLSSRELHEIPPVIFNRKILELWSLSEHQAQLWGSPEVIQHCCGQLIDPEPTLPAVELRRKDGRVISRSTPLLREDSLFRGQAEIFQDVTHQHRIRDLQLLQSQLQAAFLSKNEFLARAAHEIRLQQVLIFIFNCRQGTPLNGVVGTLCNPHRSRCPHISWSSRSKSA